MTTSSGFQSREGRLVRAVFTFIAATSMIAVAETASAQGVEPSLPVVVIESATAGLITDSDCTPGTTGPNFDGGIRFERSGDAADALPISFAIVGPEGSQSMTAIFAAGSPEVFVPLGPPTDFDDTPRHRAILEDGADYDLGEPSSMDIVVAFAGVGCEPPTSTTTTTPPQPEVLARTGSTSRGPLIAAVLLVLGGSVALRAGQQRRRRCS